MASKPRSKPSAPGPLPEWVRRGAYCTDGARLLTIRLVHRGIVELEDAGFNANALQEPIKIIVEDFIEQVTTGAMRRIVALPEDPGGGSR